MNETNIQTEKAEIEVFNVMGQTILKKKITNQKSDYDISELPKGIYFIKIYDGQVIHTSRIVKR
jgi:hypothetical protein